MNLGAYRVASEPSPDDEVLALAQLVARTRRVRRMVAVPVLLAGGVLGALGYLMLRVGVLEGIDTRAPYLSALVTVLPLIVLSQAVAAYLGRRAVKVCAPVWIAEITREGGSPVLLEAFVRSL